MIGVSLIASVCVLVANAQAFKASSGSEVKFFGADWKNVKWNWDYHVSGIEEDRKAEEDMQELGELECCVRTMTSVRTPIVSTLVCDLCSRLCPCVPFNGDI